MGVAQGDAGVEGVGDGGVPQGVWADAQLQLSRLRWVSTSSAAATGLAENYAGLQIDY